MKNNDKKLPTNCPSCSETLKVNRFICDKCKTAVEGNFELTTLTKLTPDEQKFVIEFLKLSGSLKDMAKSYAISYPTVRNKLDSIIEKITNLENKGE